MTDQLIEESQKLFSEGNIDGAIDLLKPLVDAGNLVAKSNMGLFLCYGKNTDRLERLQEGERYLIEACEAGEPSACHNLGTLWLGNSPALGRDRKKAAYYYLKARELGGPIANEEFYAEWEQEIDG